MTPEPGVVITLNQMYAELQAVHAEVRDMRGELRAGLSRIDEVDKDRERDHADHEGRVRLLEQWRWKVTGISVAGGSIAGFTVTLITRALGG